MRFSLSFRYTSTNQNNSTEEHLLSSNHQLTAFVLRLPAFDTKGGPIRKVIQTPTQKTCMQQSINFTSQVYDVENTFSKIADANSDP